jgi:hypothetical protein
METKMPIQLPLFKDCDRTKPAPDLGADSISKGGVMYPIEECKLHFREPGPFERDITGLSTGPRPVPYLRIVRKPPKKTPAS